MKGLKASPFFAGRAGPGSGSRPWLAGVDEAGRGPWAGPVIAAAVILTQPVEAYGSLADSKTLSAKARAESARRIWANALAGIGAAEPAEIDGRNILQASLLAMARAVAALPAAPACALIDGDHAPRLACENRTVIGGDGLEPAIAAASILAKTWRDRLMARACIRFPGYGFSSHKGYGTKAHRAALAAQGPCPIHRRSFAPVRAAIRP